MYSTQMDSLKMVQLILDKILNISHTAIKYLYLALNWMEYHLSVLVYKRMAVQLHAHNIV